MRLVEREGLGDASEAFQRLLDAGAGLHGARIYGDLDVTSDALTRKGAFVLLLERPDRLRFEALTSNDVTILLVVANQGQLLVYDRAANTCARGAWAGALRLGGLRLEADVAELLGLVTGRLTATVADSLRLWWDPAAERRVLEVRRGTRVAYHTLDGDQRLARTVLKDGERTLADVRYEGHEAVDGSWLPTRSTWDIPADGSHASLRVRQGALNRGFTARAFLTECPEGATVQEIAGLGACTALNQTAVETPTATSLPAVQPVEGTTDRLLGCLPGGGPPDPQTERVAP
jgi:hypothetical protein